MYRPDWAVRQPGNLSPARIDCKEMLRGCDKDISGTRHKYTSWEKEQGADRLVKGRISFPLNVALLPDEFKRKRVLLDLVK